MQTKLPNTGLDSAKRQISHAWTSLNIRNILLKVNLNTNLFQVQGHQYS
jgi:hypothetical protein